jgi:hypothetical protein
MGSLYAIPVPMGWTQWMTSPRKLVQMIDPHDCQKRPEAPSLTRDSEGTVFKGHANPYNRQAGTYFCFRSICRWTEEAGVAHAETA